MKRRRWRFGTMIVLAAPLLVAGPSIAAATTASPALSARALAKVPAAPASAHRRHDDPLFPPSSASFPQRRRSSGPHLATSPWQALVNPTPNAGAMILLTDGDVMMQDYGTGEWWQLSPDSKGSYVDGTWTQLASMPSGYAPSYFASAVLPDGRVIVEGGEYNGSSDAVVDTNLGAIYNPITNAWTSVNPPTGWAEIGDAASVVLANGKFMLQDPTQYPVTSAPDALLNPTTLTWKGTGTGKADYQDEEGWSLLPNGKVLTVDIWNGQHSELYTPSTGAWTSAGTTPVPLVASSEIGPQLLRPNGTVFATGATGHTAIYKPGTGVWAKGPTFPIIGGQHYTVADGPAAVLPDGHVLVGASPGQTTPEHFFDFNGTTLTEVADPPNASSLSTYYTYMLVLPTGQVLCRQGSVLEVYTAVGSPLSSWKPVITSVPTTLVAGSTYTVSGTQLNGLTQASAYGDDYQSATNYPLVRITNTATGDVSYARTSGMSAMSVAAKAASHASFTLSPGTETGPSTLVVVANGIASAPKNVTVNP